MSADVETGRQGGYIRGGNSRGVGVNLLGFASGIVGNQPPAWPAGHHGHDLLKVGVTHCQDPSKGGKLLQIFSATNFATVLQRLKSILIFESRFRTRPGLDLHVERV